MRANGDYNNSRTSILPSPTFPKIKNKGYHIYFYKYATVFNLKKPWIAQYHYACI